MPCFFTQKAEHLRNSDLRKVYYAEKRNTCANFPEGNTCAIPHKRRVHDLRKRIMNMKKNGLTLVEIIASCVILAIAVAGLVSIFVMSKRYMLHIRSRMASSEIARYYLDPLQMDVNQSQWGANCVSGMASACPSDVQNPGDGIMYTPKFTTGAVTGMSLRSISLTINWTEASP